MLSPAPGSSISLLRTGPPPAPSARRRDLDLPDVTRWGTTSGTITAHQGVRPSRTRATIRAVDRGQPQLTRPTTPPSSRISQNIPAWKSYGSTTSWTTGWSWLKHGFVSTTPGPQGCDASLICASLQNYQNVGGDAAGRPLHRASMAAASTAAGQPGSQEHRTRRRWSLAYVLGNAQQEDCGTTWPVASRFPRVT